jgi:hypothetical protein
MKTRIIQNDPDDGTPAPEATPESERPADVSPDAPPHVAQPERKDESPT